MAAEAAHHVQSLARGLSVITAFGPDRPQQTLSDVARATGLSRAAARRFLLTLADLGYVATDGRTFSLTPKVLDLGYSYLASQRLPALAQPHLERLVTTTRESSSLAVLDGPDVVYVARVQASRIMSVDITVGTRFPAWVTSMGRAILAYQDEETLGAHLAGMRLHPYTAHTVRDRAELEKRLATVREQGYALVDQELEDGLRSLAAPVRDPAGAVVGAVNISTLVTRHSEEELVQRFVPALLACVHAIESDLQRR